MIPILDVYMEFRVDGIINERVIRIWHAIGFIYYNQYAIWYATAKASTTPALKRALGYPPFSKSSRSNLDATCDQIHFKPESFLAPSFSTEEWPLNLSASDGSGITIAPPAQ